MTDLHERWKPLTHESWDHGQDVWLLLTDRNGVHLIRHATTYVRLLGGDKFPEYSHWQHVDKTLPPIYADAQPSELDQLRNELRKLVNEVKATLAVSQEAIREAGGNTNLECLLYRVDESSKLLSALASGTKGEQHE